MDLNVVAFQHPVVLLVSLREKGVDLNVVAFQHPVVLLVSLREKGVDLNIARAKEKRAQGSLPS